MENTNEEKSIEIEKCIRDNDFKKLLSNVTKHEKGLKVVKDKNKVDKIWSVINEINGYVKDTGTEKINVFDGYIVHLENDDWFKILKENETILGFIYYTEGIAKRYVAEGYQEKFKVTEYKVTNIRGVDRGEVTL